MATSNNSVREARRRRIAERGADRLALITGRIQTLPSLSSATSSPPPSDSARPPVADALYAAEDKASSFESPHPDSPVESEKINTNYGENKAEPLSTKFQTSRGISKPSNIEQTSRLQSSRVPQIVQQDSRVESMVRRNRFFTTKQINSAISATENTRIYCSVAVAILVSLSYIGFPILANSITKSIIYYRPLYLVFITGISVVLKRLVLEGQGVQRLERKINEAPLVSGYGSAERLAKVLELGLCFKNITNAVFMEFSVYAIVLICTLAFAQRFG